MDDCTENRLKEDMGKRGSAAADKHSADGLSAGKLSAGGLSAGKLTLGRLRELITDGSIETVVVAYADQYGQLMGKRLTGRYFLESVLSPPNPAETQDSASVSAIAGCNYVLTADIDMTPLPGFTLAGWEQGFGDFLIQPDSAAVRYLPWCEKTVLIVADLMEKSGKPVSRSPRRILQHQISLLQKRGCRAFCASELEFFLFDVPVGTLYQSGISAMTPASGYPVDYHILAGNYHDKLFGEISRSMDQAGIFVESTKGETGLGQYEIALKYDSALEMADRHVVYKNGVKTIAQQHAASVTFMAKYAQDAPGSSCHIHMSLRSSADGRNLFDKDDSLFKHFLAGVIELTQEMFLFYAPTVNSYKRFAEGSFAPVNVSWGYDNRTVGYRIVGKGSSLRIENRFPGADADPYTAYAAMIASGQYGIDHELELPESVSGSAYADGSDASKVGHNGSAGSGDSAAAGSSVVAKIPRSLKEAADCMDASERVRNLLGDEVVDHYVRHARQEDEAYRRTVSSWEVMRYFERI